MITDPHDNIVFSRFDTAASLQRAAHYFDLKVTLKDEERQLNKMVVEIILREVKNLTALGLRELKEMNSE